MGGRAATTVATVYEYRVQLRLGSVENLFPDDVTTPMGKKMRLQVLGMFNRPLNHDAGEVQDCLEVSWRHFKEVLYPMAPGVPRTDAQAEAHMLTLLDEYLVQGAALPNDGQFARMCIPGGFPVFYSVSEPQAIGGSPYRLGGDRFQVERAFYDANPILGKIPIIARVERRTGTNPWQSAPAGISVYFQLIPPDDISVGAASAGVRGGTLAANPNTYFDQHVRGYDPSAATDPQACNVHWHLGGKRKLGAASEVGGDRAWNIVGAVPRACRRENVFSIATVDGFNVAHGGRALPHTAFPTATVPAMPAAHPSAVTAGTNANGEAGVIFQPSLIGGDRYKLRAYVGAAQPVNNAVPGIALTGTMVRWRTIRMSYYVQNRGAAGLAQLPVELQNLINTHAPACTHTNGDGRICLQCVQREEQVDTIDFGPGHHISNELAKSFCHMIVEPSAANPLPMNNPGVVAAMQRAVAAVAGDAAAMGSNVQGEDIGYGKSFFKNTYQFQLAYGNIVPGSLRIKINYVDIATDDSIGALTNLAGTLVGGSGTINYVTGQLTIRFKFGSRPAKSVKINVNYTTTSALDLNTLFYYPNDSPYMFNLRTLDDYNARTLGPHLKARPERQLLGVPVTAYAGVKNTLLGNKILPRFLKEIADNRGVGTGLVLVQSPNYETWEGFWPVDCGPTMNGKGIASGFMLLQGNYYRAGPYPLPAIDTAKAAYPLEPLAMHEMGHCLYMQHSPQGTQGQERLHDCQGDVCVMGYAACDGDFCGQCVASYMGMNIEDERFRHQILRTRGGADLTKANLDYYYPLDPSG